MKIATIGEALIDFKATGPLAFQGFVGGSPLNVAVAAARLGAEVGFISQISKDLFGAHLRAHMEASGLDTRFLLTSDAPSTLAFVDERGGDAHFEFLGSGAADRGYDPRPRPSLPDELAFLQFGSISLLFEPAQSAITDIVAAHQGRAVVVFDPNVRPALIGGDEAARKRYQNRLEGWLALSDLVKVSAQDLNWLEPDAPIEETARAWLARGPRAVVVTRGSRGVSLVRQASDVLSVAVPEVRVVDTVGAGDTFTGAMMTALLERGATELAAVSDESWREALAFAAAAAALNCQRAGADPPGRAEVARLLRSAPPR